MNEQAYHLKQIRKLTDLLRVVDCLPADQVSGMASILEKAGYTVHVTENPHGSFFLHSHSPRWQQVVWIQAHDAMTYQRMGFTHRMVDVKVETDDPRRWAYGEQSLRKTYRELIVNLIRLHSTYWCDIHLWERDADSKRKRAG